jgi:hypothetical protein
VGNFNGLPDWHPWVKESVLEPAAGGVGRRITIDGAAGRYDLAERLVAYSAEGLEYAYTIVGGPSPRRDYVGRIRVVPKASDKCMVEVEGRFRAAPGITDAEATERFRRFYGVAFSRLQDRFGR